MSDSRTQATAEATIGGGDRKPRETTEQSLLIDVHAVSMLMDCSARHVWRLADAGKMPRLYKIGALCRWDRSLIKAWIADGCPNCRTGRKGAAR